MQVGYIRISTVGQNTARQEVLMQELGVERVFIDRMSGKSADRPELKAMMHTAVVSGRWCGDQWPQCGLVATPDIAY